MPEVHLKFFEHPVERTEEEIEELRRGGLLREDPPAPPQDPPAEPKGKKEQT
jgi:hypothetical protein